jgi:DNA ligase 1
MKKLMPVSDYKNEDPCGWWMSEKLDGIRAEWNGSFFISKNGNEFDAPDWFIEDMPDGVHLDGELWSGRGTLHKTASEVRAQGAAWGRVKFMVFDVISKGTYEARKNALSKCKLPNHCRIIEQFICKSRDHLDNFNTEVLVSGGEGVMLRRTKSIYSTEKSRDLLRIKDRQTDEATVVSHTITSVGRIGSIVCNYMGKAFKLGVGRSELPEIGSCVTFSFFGLTPNGIPWQPALVIVRDYE